MILVKINFINLLPFDVFCKRNLPPHRYQIMRYKQDFPANINRAFKHKRINASFVSSIEALKSVRLKKVGKYYCFQSKNGKVFGVGIVGKEHTNSVLCIENIKSDKKLCIDSKSATSNVLAKILRINGKVIIGDDALRYYYANTNNNFIDLAMEYRVRYSLPFVFAMFVANKEYAFANKLSYSFFTHKGKIPYYIMKNTANKNSLSVEQIKEYLKLITYNIGYKEARSLKKFKKLTKKSG